MFDPNAVSPHPPTGGGGPRAAAALAEAARTTRNTGPRPRTRRDLRDFLAAIGQDIGAPPDPLDDELATDDLAELIANTDDAIRAVARSQPQEALLAAQIDADLGARVWNGTTLDDRLGRLDTTLRRALFDEVEKSLMAQESYDDFEQRMLGKLGVGAIEPRTGGKAMRQMEGFLDNEARLGWNEGLLAANQQEDTILVWAAVLDENTTPGCWDNHGRTQAEVGDDSIPAHEKCRCRWLVSPNPDSEDAEWARMGQQILEDMADERDSGDATPMREAQAVRRPSRFRSWQEPSVVTFA